MRIRKDTTSWIMALIATLLLCGFAAPANASIPSSLVPVPAPGHSSTWDMPLMNTTDTRVAVWFGVSEETSKLPLVLEISDANGRTVFGPTTLADLASAEAKLGDLAAGASTQYEGRVSMPRDVGNDMQGLSQSTTFRFSLMSSGDTGAGPTLPGGLARTGFMLSWLLPLALALILLGLLVVRWRRREDDDSNEGSTIS